MPTRMAGRWSPLNGLKRRWRAGGGRRSSSAAGATRHPERERNDEAEAGADETPGGAGILTGMTIGEITVVVDADNRSSPTEPIVDFASEREGRAAAGIYRAVEEITVVAAADNRSGPTAPIVAYAREREGRAAPIPFRSRPRGAYGRERVLLGRAAGMDINEMPAVADYGLPTAPMVAYAREREGRAAAMAIEEIAVAADVFARGETGSAGAGSDAGGRQDPPTGEESEINVVDNPTTRPAATASSEPDTPPVETEADAAKRRAIRAILSDTSLPDVERRRRVQMVMDGTAEATAAARNAPGGSASTDGLLAGAAAALAAAMAFEAEIAEIAPEHHPGRNFLSRPHFARRRFVPSPSPARRLLKLTGNPQVPFDDDESMPSLVDGF